MTAMIISKVKKTEYDLNIQLANESLWEQLQITRYYDYHNVQEWRMKILWLYKKEGKTNKLFYLFFS